MVWKLFGSGKKSAANPKWDSKSRAVEETLDRAIPGAPVDRRILRDVLDRIYDFGCVSHYVEWVHDYVPCSGRLLDVGCANAWYAPYFLARGVDSYYGIDICCDLKTREITNLEKKTDNCTMPISLGELVSCFQDVDLVRGDICEVHTENAYFDNVVMLQTTEHLEKPEEVFKTVAEAMKIGGHILVSHHNFYCWNGHHFPPQTVAEYDPTDLAMFQVADWNHIHNMDYLRLPEQFLNFIRIHELIAIFKNHFEVKKIEKIYSSVETGRDRLTPEIRNSLADYYEDELLVETLRLVGEKTVRTQKESLPLLDVIPLSPSAATGKEGECWLVPIPLGVKPDDYVLFENESELGPRDTLHEEIRRLGGGRYSIWGKYVYMSSSDNSDPVANGRQYTLRSSSRS